jgi:hypothetical protein
MIVRPLVVALLAGASNAFAPSFARRSVSSLNANLDDKSSSSQPSPDDKDNSGPEEEESRYLEYLENMAVTDNADSDISDEAPSDVSDEAPDDVETPPDVSSTTTPSETAEESEDLEDMAVTDNADSDISDEAPSDISDEAPSDISDEAPYDVEIPPDGSSTTTPSETAEETIMTLLQIAASTGRGEFATQSQKDQAADLIAALELQNPTSEPANSPMINGRWELLYSSTQLFRSSPFFMAGRAVCSTPEQAKQYDWFCDMHRKALAISSIGQVRQVVSPTKLVSEFEVQVGAVPFLSDFTPFAYSGGWPVS